MKKYLLCLFLILNFQILLSQVFPYKIEEFLKDSLEDIENKIHNNSENDINYLYSLIIIYENANLYNDLISQSTRKLISTLKLIDPLAHMESKIVRDRTLPLAFKDKMIKYLSYEINLKTKEQYSIYSYDTKIKKKVSFISVRSGNDLFTMAGISNFLFNVKFPDKGIVFQRNDDRDYTGSLLIELGSDYLSHISIRPKLKYSIFIFGFDVYTPYFRDTANYFKSDTGHNPNDRPHATFQFYGFGQKGIGFEDKLKYSIITKFGKIGGKFGEKFQNELHQDISGSPRPKGWRAQIADGGRFGFSIESNASYKIFASKGFDKKRANINQVWSSYFVAGMFGTYMTNFSFGLQCSNRSFNQTNDNYITFNSKINRKWNEAIMYNVSFKYTRVVHNTMLEGYGWYNTTENQDKNDPLTPHSIYYLDKQWINKIVPTLNIALAYSFTNFTLFYNWMSIGPETKLGDINIKSPYSGLNLNIKNRWHHFAEIGIALHY